MYTESYEYPPSPNLHNLSLYKKNQPENLSFDHKYDSIYTMNRVPTTIEFKEWANYDYNNLKRVSDDKNNLRQTFDVKAQSKFQQTLSKFNPDNEESFGAIRKIQANLRQTMSTRPRFMDQYSYNASNMSHSPVFNNESFKIQNRNLVSTQKLEIDFNKYKEQLEQIQINNKMTQQLRKLKEDRKKRMEANQEEKAENFKKKNVADYYSPKYEKVDVAQILEQSKTMPLKHPNLEKYKYQPSKFAKVHQKERSIFKTSVEKLSTNENSSNQKMVRERSYTQFAPISRQQHLSRSPIKAQKPNLHHYNTSPMSLTQINPSSLNSPSAPLLMPGMEVGDFIIGKNLGEGKFGTVYQVIHKPTGSIFALKKVPKEKIKVMNMVHQFILQIKLQTFLHHQNILSLYGFFDDAHSIYLILEYMQQGTLYSLLKKKKTLAENVVAQKVKHIASAINYMHQNQIAHRDIKPQNIVITNGVCKLCDFGWATICKSRRTTCCGTFDYTPPEIFQGEQYDYTVDLWCLGVLTYELLVGKAPFYHSRREQTKNRILNVDNFTINYPQHLSASAISFIDNLLQKDPKDRLSSEDLLNHPFLKNAEEDL